VRTPNGCSKFLDLGWEQWQVGVEYDGMGVHLGLEAETGDRPRHQVLRNLGWEVLVLTASDVMEHPRPWLVRLRETLLERGWDPDPNQLRDINERIEAVNMALNRH
jgi:very-short-patch-repair endonuclease